MSRCKYEHPEDGSRPRTCPKHGVACPGDAQRTYEAALSPAQRVEEGPHTDDVAVDRFAAAMKTKLAKKRDEGRGGWEGPACNMEFLSKLLREHVEKGDPLDVGNLAMMLHQLGERITASPAPAPHAMNELMKELYEVAKDKVTYLESALWCNRNGKWDAAIGGHGAVSLGEWSGDFHTRMNWNERRDFDGFDTPEEAIADLIELVKTEKSYAID